MALPVLEDTPHSVLLKSNEDKYRSLVEDVLVNAAAGILILDADFKVIWVSQALERYFGLRCEELLDQDYRQLLHHRLKYIFEDPDGFAKKILATYIDNTAPARFECHVLPGEGRQERWLEHRSQPIHTGRYAGGRIEHYYGLTNRKQAELILAAHARQQAALFHLSADLVATLDPVNICRKTVNGLRHTLNYDHVAILLLDETTGERVQCVSNPVLAEEPLPLRLRPGEGLSELPLLDGRAHYTPDVTKTPQYVPGLRGKSEVDVPLQVDGKILGVLVVENEQVNGFNEDDFAVLTAAANQTAIALARAREHQAVKEAEIRYQSLFDRVPMGLYRSTSEGQFLEANLALVEMLGYPDRATFLAINSGDLYANIEDRRRWRRLLEQKDLLRDFEVQIHRRDGVIIWVRNSARVVRDDEGRILYYEGSVEDVTERKQAEEEIRCRNRDLALLNRVIAASAASSDVGTILETVCRELAIAFQLPQAAVSILNADKTEVLVVADYRSEGRPAAYRQPIPIKNVAAVQYILTHKTYLTIADVQTDPRVAPQNDLMHQRGNVSTLAVPIIIEQEVMGILGLEAIEFRPFSAEEINLAQSMADQVAAALARNRLDEEHRRLSAAIQQMAESVIITDTQGTIAYVNPAFEQVSGYSRAEVMGQNISIVSSDQHPPDFHQELWAAIRAGQVWHGQVVNRKKNDVFYTEAVIITPVRNAHGEIDNFVSVQRDITHELELEEQLRRSQRLEAVGQLTAGIAHDFNNSLTAINGFAELIQYQLPPDSPLYDMAGKILHSGQHAADLVTQLLAFSRKQMIRPKVLDLNAVVINIEKMLRRVIGEQIELDIIPAVDLWPVEVDPTQLEQVIINLAVNARDAMSDGGKLTIETANVVLDEAYVAAHLETQPGDHVLLTVSDTGCGMSKAVQAHIFEPFFTTKEVNEGTGLGLSTVFGIVKQSRGNIWVYSEEGVGTTFKIYLPRAATSIFSVPPTHGGVLPRGIETILLVEDEALVRDLASRVLREQGYTVLVANNGWEALRLAHEHIGVIHLLLTDVVMPGIGGKALADQLMAVSPNLKVLFTSGYTNNSVVTQGMLLPGIKFLEKPFSSVSLTHKVREVLDSSTP